MRSTLLASLVIVSLGSPAVARQHQPAPLSPVHEKLAKRAGNYTTNSKISMPGGQTMEAAGTAKLSAAVGGRFLLEENTGTMMGSPITGLRLFGYNTDAGRYEAIWTYSMSNAIMTLTGQSKDDGKTVTCAASYLGADSKATQFTITYRFVGEDHFTVELTARNNDGTPGPTLETRYTRAK